MRQALQQGINPCPRSGQTRLKRVALLRQGINLRSQQGVGALQFGVAQLEAGADALTLPDHATGDLVSAEYYQRYLRDLHIEFDVGEQSWTSEV